MGKKRNLGKDGGTSEIKESREKKAGEREASRGRGNSNRRGRGNSRGREGVKKTKNVLLYTVKKKKRIILFVSHHLFNSLF